MPPVSDATNQSIRSIESLRSHVTAVSLAESLGGNLGTTGNPGSGTPAPADGPPQDRMELDPGNERPPPEQVTTESMEDADDMSINTTLTAESPPGTGLDQEIYEESDDDSVGTTNTGVTLPGEYSTMVAALSTSSAPSSPNDTDDRSIGSANSGQTLPGDTSLADPPEDTPAAPAKSYAADALKTPPVSAPPGLGVSTPLAPLAPLRVQLKSPPAPSTPDASKWAATSPTAVTPKSRGKPQSLPTAEETQCMASEEEVPLPSRHAAALDPDLDHPMMVHDLVNKEDGEENDYSSSGEGSFLSAKSKASKASSTGSKKKLPPRKKKLTKRELRAKAKMERAARRANPTSGSSSNLEDTSMNDAP
jgi:hypothetical protein